MKFFLADMTSILSIWGGLIMWAPAKNNSNSCLSYGPSTALYPPTHPDMRTRCTLETTHNPEQSCGFISYRDPYHVLIV